MDSEQQDEADYASAATTANCIVGEGPAPAIEPSIEGIMFALRQVSEESAVILNLPRYVWDAIEPWHTAIRMASDDEERRLAWSAWHERVEWLRGALAQLRREANALTAHAH